MNKPDTRRPAITELNERSREIFRRIVDTYMETGDPVGSRTISQRLSTKLSPASIRSVMADLEDAGLLYAPHTSAGRIPTEAGLRMFVDGLLEVGNLSSDERRDLEGRVAGTGQSVERLLEEASSALSGLSHCAGLVLAPKTESPLKHIEFVNLGMGRALVVLVTADGVVENRLVTLPGDVPASALVEATNFLNRKLVGRTLEEARQELADELAKNQMELDALTTQVVEAGLATWAGGERGGHLIIRGQAHLLEDVTAVADLERIRALFAALETEETMIHLLELAESGEGVQIFIGADNDLFSVSGCSLIVAPYHSSQQQLLGAIGVIGPVRMNYARIIPMVDYSAKLIGKIIG